MRQRRGAFYVSDNAPKGPNLMPSIGGENNSGVNIHSRFRSDPEPQKKQIPIFGTSDSLYNYYLEAVRFGCGHQEENKWIRRSPVFWALRLH